MVKSPCALHEGTAPVLRVCFAGPCSAAALLNVSGRCQIHRSLSHDTLMMSACMQVLLLGQQLLPENLLASNSVSSSGAEVLKSSLTLASQGTECGDQHGVSARTHTGPTAQDIDRAIKAIEGCICWRALQQSWAPPAAATAVRSNGEASQHDSGGKAGPGDVEAGGASAIVSESKTGPCIHPETTEHSMQGKSTSQNPASSGDGIPQCAQASKNQDPVHV